MQRNQALPAKQLIEFHIEKYDVEGRQLFLNHGVQRRATTQGEHTHMIRENSTNKATLQVTESFSPQLDNQLTGGQAALILHVIIEIAKRDTQLARHQPPHSALSRPWWTDEYQNWSAHHAPDLFKP